MKAVNSFESALTVINYVINAGLILAIILSLFVVDGGGIANECGLGCCWCLWFGLGN